MISIRNLADDQPSSADERKFGFLAFIIAIAILIAFSPLFQADFINIDDPDYVVNNEDIRQLDAKHVTDMFIKPRGDMYIPLVYLSYAVEYSVFKATPAIYHIDNILLHIINSLLVLWIIWLLGKRLYVSVFVATLFALHPLHVESVAWISERKDLLYAMFFLAAIVSYHFYASGRNFRLYLLALFLFILSCLSKPMAVTLPCLLLCYDFFYREQRSWKIIYDKVPFFVISAIVSLIAVKMMNLSFHESLAAKYSIADRAILTLSSFFFYLQKTIVPINLSAVYLYPEKAGGALPLYYFSSALFFLIVTVVIFFYANSVKAIRAGFIFFIITVFPVLQFFPNTYTITADRYSYIPTLGLLCIIVSVAERVRKRMRIDSRKYLRIGLAIFALLGLATYSRSRVWKDGITLYTDIVKKGSYSDRHLCVLGDLYDNKGEYFEAIRVFRTADSLYPEKFSIKSRYAYCLGETGQYDLAIDEYNECLRLDSSNIGLYVNLGDAYIKTYRLNEALVVLQKGHALYPENEAILFNLAYTFWGMNSQSEALKYLRICIKRGYIPAMEFVKKYNIEIK